MKPLVFSGVQPTGNLHLGNYLGAVKRFVELQATHECIYCVVDLHAITVPQDPKELVAQIREVTAAFLAAGIDPKKSIVFNQSRVAGHAELTWVFNCVARLGWLNRMTQFKEKAGKDRENASIGLYDYPVLMAADILVYRATHVPVGDDQKQHVELTRDLADRFNSRYGTAFTVPMPVIQKETARIYDLQNPTAKMSKSAESDAGVLWLLDDPAVSAKKIMRAVTDSEGAVRYDRENKPGVSNLLVIYAALTGRQIPAIEDEYAGRGYGDFKRGLAEVVVNEFGPVRQRALELLSDPAELDRVLATNADRAAEVADATLADVYAKVGLLRRG